MLLARLEGSPHILLGQLLTQPLELGLGQAVGVIASRGREVLRQAAQFVVGQIYPHIVQHLLKHRRFISHSISGVCISVYLYILKTKLAAKNGLKIKGLESFAHILHNTHLIPNRVHQFRELRLGSHLAIVKVSPAPAV